MVVMHYIKIVYLWRVVVFDRYGWVARYEKVCFKYLWGVVSLVHMSGQE